METLCSLLCPCVTIGDPVSSASADETPLLAPNEEEGQLESYEVLGKLGEGAYAVVKEIRHRSTGQRYALKLIVKARSDEQDVARDLSVLKRVGTHRNIVSLVESFDLERTFALVLEFAGGGEVFQRMASRGQYSERDAMALVAQVGSALQHIHACSVSHRDLKPENLLLESSAEDAPVKVCEHESSNHQLRWPWSPRQGPSSRARRAGRFATSASPPSASRPPRWCAEPEVPIHPGVLP